MADDLMLRLRAADPAAGLPEPDREELAARDQAMLERITALPPDPPPMRRRQRGRRGLAVVVAAAVIAGGVAAARIITSSTPPSEPTELAGLARQMDVDRAQFGGFLLGEQAQLRIPAAGGGTWEAAFSAEGGDLLLVKPPSQRGADGIACPPPADDRPVWACLRGAAGERFVAGRASAGVARIVLVDDAGEVLRDVPLADGIYLLPDPPVQARLRALAADGAVLGELLVNVG